MIERSAGADWRKTTKRLLKRPLAETVLRLAPWLECRGWYVRPLDKRFMWGVSLWHDLHRLGLPNDSSTVVFDVGANVGDWLFTLLRHFPRVRTFAFEPASATFSALRKRCGSMANVHVNNIALSNKTDAVDLYLFPSSGSNSMNPEPKIGSRGIVEPVGKESVPCTTLDAFCRTNRIEKIDLLKLDVEGNECNVIAGASSMLQRRCIKMIYAEVTFYENRLTHFKLLQELLEVHNYQLVCIYNESVKNGRFSYGSALFVNAGRHNRDSSK